jgi:hypothetical protein
MKVQLILDKTFSELGGELASQWASMTNDIGLVSTEYMICPRAKRKAMLAACSSRKDHGTKGCGPFSLNSIFDTGSNTLMGPNPKILKI